MKRFDATNLKNIKIINQLGEGNKMRAKHFINGQWQQSASTRMFTSINPANEQVIAHLPDGNSEDINAAVEAARNAFEHGPWPKLTGAERGQYLQKMADL